jgi:PTS system cellobiose-specific IIB component
VSARRSGGGRELSAVAGTEQSLPIDLDAADVVLVGPHLHCAGPHPSRPRRRAVRVVLLPPTSSPTSTARARSRSSTSAGRAPTSTPRRGTRMTEASRTIRIGSSNGLHARPAKLFAQAAKDSGIP